MKKVIVYGVNNIELRRKMETFIDEKYCIIGYSDTYFPKDILDNKTFYKREELASVNCDYIILCINHLETCKMVREQLIELGVDCKKIVIPYLFLERNYIYQKDLIKHVEEKLTEDVEAIIFGLSYSLRGIDKELLKVKTFDFSWHGLDLYYNYRLFKYALDRGLITSKIHTAILVFPYAYFNHDMSRERYQYEIGEIFSTFSINDWHNADKVVGIDAYEYITSYYLFGEKFIRYYDASENIYIYNCINKDTPKILLGHTWNKCHKETIEEYIVIFKEFITLVKKYVSRVVMVVPPYCLDKIEVSDEVIQQHKSLYYSVAHQENVEIIDFFEIWKDKYDWFCDVRHLNYEGAKIFTDKLNESLFNKNK